MNNICQLLREAWASARSQIVASALTIVMVAGMVVAAIMTTGQTAAAEEAAIRQIDAVGTRSIIIRAQEGAGINASVLERISAILEVESVIGFGPIFDVRNSLIMGAAPVGVRAVYGRLTSAGLAEIEGIPGAIYVSPDGTEALGMADSVGDAVANNGIHYQIRGAITVPDYLDLLEPLVLLRANYSAEDSENQPISTLVILASTPQNVLGIARAASGLLGAADPQLVTIETSASLAAVRAAVSGELGAHNRNLVIAILGIAGLLVAINLLGLVQLRRKDFGRRRALGASQTLIIILLLTQTFLLSILGIVIGTALSLALLAYLHNPIPQPSFITAVAIGALLTAMVASLAPAVVAARREPLHELRIA